MLTSTRARLAAATGAAFVVLLVVGDALSIAGTSQASHKTGAQVVKDAAHQASSALATVGFIMECAGFVAFLAFLGYLAYPLVGRDQPGSVGESSRSTTPVARRAECV